MLCGIHHPCVGHQHQDEILEHEVGAQRSRRFGALDNIAQPGGSGTELTIELGGAREREREHVRAPRIGGLHGARGADEAAKPRPRVCGGNSYLGCSLIGTETWLEGSRNQALASREPPVQGGDPHVSPPGDLL